MGVNETLEKKEEDMRKGDVILFVSRLNANNEATAALKDALENRNSEHTFEKYSTFERRYHNSVLDSADDNLFRLRDKVNTLITVATAYLQTKNINTSYEYTEEAIKLTLASLVRYNFFLLNTFDNTYMYERYSDAIRAITANDSKTVDIDYFFDFFADAESEYWQNFANRVYEIASQVNSIFANSYFLELIENETDLQTLKNVNYFARTLSRATNISTSKIFCTLTDTDVVKISTDIKNQRVATDNINEYIHKFTELSTDIARRAKKKK